MNSIYDEYFGTKDFYDSLADFLYDIKENKISKNDVIFITDELIKNKRIPEKSNFKIEEKSKWNKEYVTYLMSGGSAGKLSKEYIIYFAEVSNYVSNKKKTLIIAGAIIVAIIIIIGMVIKLS